MESSHHYHFMQSSPHSSYKADPDLPILPYYELLISTARLLELSSNSSGHI